MKLDAEFHALDRIVMRHSFDIQNELGRLCSEKIYQRELVRRCRLDNRIDCVESEVAIPISYKKFTKVFRADIVINGFIIYEIKAVESLMPEHDAQLLKYLMISSRQFGKLINFKPHSVDSRFVTTTISREDRFEYSIEKTDWNNNACIRLEELFIPLLEVWGLFLSPSLYTEGLTYILGGKELVINGVQVISDQDYVGHQKFYMLDETSAFKITSICSEANNFERNVYKLLNHTGLHQILWINFMHHTVNMKALHNSSIK